MNKEILDRLFRESRTVNKFLDKEVSDETIRELYDLTKMGPTAFNAQPARFLFLKSKESKERLRPYLMEGNIEKTIAAPVTVIVAMDYYFHNLLPKTFPIADISGLFVGNQEMIDITAFRNGTLSGAYLIMAARAMGLDVGPMSGFNNAGVDEEFFKGTDLRSNFLINIGYSDNKTVYSRLPRLDFDETSKIL